MSEMPVELENAFEELDIGVFNTEFAEKFKQLVFYCYKENKNREYAREKLMVLYDSLVIKHLILKE